MEDQQAAAAVEPVAAEAPDGAEAHNEKQYNEAVNNCGSHGFRLDLTVSKS